MSFYNCKCPPYILALVVSLFCLSGLPAAYAQTEPHKSVPNPAQQTTADENFELNITQERIAETNFSRSTQVELSNNNRGRLRVEVGVGVRAESIDVLLRGIFGRVRFRASLEALRQRIERLPATTQNSNTPSP